MDSLPVETWQHIFELACTDGGYTGCSLSAVSKRIRAMSASTRFHSVYLVANPRRLPLFAALYQRECERGQGGCKPLLRHLYVAFPRLWREEDEDRFYILYYGRRRSLSPRRTRSDSGATADAQAECGQKADTVSPGRGPLRNAPPAPPRGRPLPTPPAPYPNPGTLVGPPTQEPPPSPADSPEYIEAARTLFRLAAPDLQSLVVQCGFSMGSNLDLSFLTQPFPLLREITFVGISKPCAVIADEAEASPVFPAATHLYIVPHDFDLDLPFWSKHAPNVTHLGVSAASDWANVDGLAPALGIPEEYLQYARVRRRTEEYSVYPRGHRATPPPELPSPPPPRTYPSVRYLLLESSAPQMYMCGNGYMSYKINLAVLKDLGSKALESGVTVVVLRAPEYSATRYADECAQMRASWIARMEGMAGLWDGLNGSGSS
ncbi:hypothetical protein OH77DRAFT_1423910 [Trametes cingulata]|nr:hypothetical protein OH77DRAFT_1423910 [Trametes cingulata]